MAEARLFTCPLTRTRIICFALDYLESDIKSLKCKDTSSVKEK